MEPKWAQRPVSFIGQSKIADHSALHPKQTDSMLRSSIFLPADCTEKALADFENLVVEGGAVNPTGLAQRIRDASRLLFLRTPDDRLVGTGALKHPRAEYRNKVFADAHATVSAHEYPVELGWVVVAKIVSGTTALNPHRCRIARFREE
jgi:hypothetical protein